MGRPVRRCIAPFSTRSESGAEREAEFVVADRAWTGGKARRRRGSTRRQAGTGDHAPSAPNARSRAPASGRSSVESGPKSHRYRATRSGYNQSGSDQPYTAARGTAGLEPANTLTLRTMRPPACLWRWNAADRQPCGSPKARWENRRRAAPFRNAPGSPPAWPCRRSTPAGRVA